jgi:NAD(P)-dependent dehydrogenase (short-subunit alcohol dehydrogenase family)
MKLLDRTVVVTGAASGIGRALALRFARERPRGLVLADLPRAAQAIEALAASLEAGDGAGRPPVPALAVPADVGVESQVRALVAAADASFGHVDVFCSNAGLIRDGDEHQPDADWAESMQVHLMAHVYAARAVVPGMRARGEGYLLNTASAAGLITSLPSATYAVSKHAAIALAEWLAIRHGDAGVRVSVLCPQAVDTPMIAGRAGAAAAANDGVIGADALAEAVVAGLDAESFLILPHPQVLQYFQRKAQDYDRWIGGMRRFAARLDARPPADAGD